MISQPEAAIVWIEALVAKRFDRLCDAFAPEVRFRALVPGESFELDSAAAVAEVFERWFRDKERLELLAVHADQVGDRCMLRYRLRLERAGEPLVVEQSIYGDLEGNRFVALDLVCSGFRPVDAAPAEGMVHRFEAGDLGCGTGLPREFRARIGRIPLGHRLAVVTRDPASREDLPALARLMGHRVHSVDSGPGGDVIILVERMK